MEANARQKSRLAVWERWWSSVDGRPGEVVWDAAESDLVADLEVFADAFTPDLPVVDLGCGDGRQTRFLARHFQTVIGGDISPAAIEHARAADNLENVSYRVLDARSPEEAERLHNELGDANVYIRGVLQALPAADRPDAVRSIAALLGETGTLFAKELPPEADAYFAEQVQRHGMWPELERMMRLIPPGQITELELVTLITADHFEVIDTGASHIHTVNVLPDGEPMTVPSIYLLARPRTAGARPGARADRSADLKEPDVRAVKERARMMWAAGDYPAFARMIADAGAASARRAGAAPGLRLLDVACGDGNVAILAARAGASVTALDLTPELLAAGRERAARDGVSIDWLLGDVEELPFDDESFDAVTSNFGAIYAPRHAVAARELARVCRPGGTIVMTVWAPDGFNARLAEIGARYIPPPPFPEPPSLWADPEHARACFEGAGIDVGFDRDTAHARFPSVRAAVELMGRSYGPAVLARERLIEEGNWEPLRAEIAAEHERWARPVADGVQIDMDYIVITGRKRAERPLNGGGW